MTDTRTPVTATGDQQDRPARGIGGALRAAEIDTRLVGMLVALALIWVAFHIMSGGTFLTPRNLWILSVQTASVAIMATGMVLVIVSRNIDLSVGSLVGVLGMSMALIQAEILPGFLGFDHPLTWIIALVAGIALGAVIGGFQGAIVAYVGVPSFIVTLGGLLVWRGTAWALSSGRTVAPMDSTFQLLGGGSRGSIGGGWSWFVGIATCFGIVALLADSRRQRRKYDFRLRPMWAEITLGVVACGAVLAAVFVLNRYYLPEGLARVYAEERGIEYPEAGLNISAGIAYPVLIALGVALVMTFIATRRRFGRYVYAIGGNPEAAELGGINSRRTIVKTFALMGALVGLAAAVQIARLNAAVSGLGTLTELYVIAAAVIGGTSFAGGIGTIPGAVLGALLMQSLQSGMVLMNVDAPLQNIVVGIVLVIAVTLDSIYRRRAS
ncbi:sugar ABC transporter permease [Nitriliruptor alkaliphilus]|uniref:sugar ABC transporter permease n=1 Tax=Nitriliruptor alkaliphilus TaxID=427918 RepID=UPI0006963611|nr:sugar ABC transporter permease [Nitriliruptor alkaliphilus]